MKSSIENKSTHLCLEEKELNWVACCKNADIPENGTSSQLMFLDEAMFS